MPELDHNLSRQGYSINTKGGCIADNRSEEKELKKLNTNDNARLHVDTNVSILRRDYIDELIQTGMTDIGTDLKGLYPETFMCITGIEDKELAEKYKRTAWENGKVYRQ